MRSRILATVFALGATGILASCDLGESIQEVFNVASVSFSSADPAYDGPRIGGPSWGVTGAAILAQKMGLPDGKTTDQIMGEYYLDLTFKVNADNSKNTQKASFGQTVRPLLRLRMNDKNATSYVESEMAPFSVEGGQVGALEFPVRIPLTQIDRTTLGKILDGDDIPYFLSGTLNFNLLEGTTIKGSGKSEIDLATGAIPTRSKDGDLDLSQLGSLLQ
ncbi:MAG TPA: hypothetical protein PK208_02420 [Fibrobacteria bacterium]|nr:hypothetical protein [Fibrobacteria bacterium]